MNELQKGIREEGEHVDLYKSIKKKGLPPKQTFFKSIAQAHVKEDPNYYSKLDRELRQSALKRKSAE